jgi:hypothetical protein
MSLIVPGFRVRITALSNASLRTKNRIRENGEDGFIFRQETNVIALDNRRGVLLESLTSSGKRGDAWMGWLPLDEVEMEIWVD